MDKMKELPIPINKAKIGLFCQKYHIAFLALFGSILTPHFNPASDVDILVKFDQEHIPTLFGLIDIECELSSIMGRKVDLRTPNDLSPYFRQDVLSHSQVIYGG